jgi:hypothetical protein
MKNRYFSYVVGHKLWKTIILCFFQLLKKRSEMEAALEKLAASLSRSYPELSGWAERQAQTHSGMACELKPIRPSPVTDGYRNKCEFRIGMHFILKYYSSACSLNFVMPRIASGDQGKNGWIPFGQLQRRLYGSWSHLFFETSSRTHERNSQGKTRLNQTLNLPVSHIQSLLF